MTNRPCKECPDRHIGCHADCEDYLIFKSECDRIRQNEQAERKTINTLHSIKTAELEQTRRRRGLKSIKYR